MSIKVLDFKIEPHGIDHAQYFQGAGTANTKWDYAIVGAGGNAHEALEDALDQIACMGYDIDHIENPYDANVDNSVRLGWVHALWCPASFDYVPSDEELDEDGDFDPFEQVCVCGYNEYSELWYYVIVYIEGEEETVAEEV